MRNLKKINNDDIVFLLENDDIKRNKYLKKFIKILCNNGYNQVFSLDGSWGSGKTIFVKKLELLINYYSFYENGEKLINNNYINKNTKLSDDNIQKLEVISKFDNFKEIKEMVRNNNLNAIYFNAWEHDDEIDPIISIICEIINKFDLFDSTKKIGMGNLVDNFKSLVSLFSKGQLNIGTLIEEEELSTCVNLKNKIKEAFSDVLNDIINENCDKLVIFIDELDRCKPDYAVDLLERINHYLNDERVLIVLSTNIIELTHTISSKYGNNFSSEKYLDKFIDERLFLPEILLDDYLNTFDSMIKDGASNGPSRIATWFIKTYHLQMREINRYMGCMKHFEKFIYDYIPFDNHMKIIYNIIIPYIVGLYIIFPSKYESFKKGKGFNDFKNLIYDNDKLIKFCKDCFYGTTENIDDEMLFNDLEKYYNFIFNDKNITSFLKINNYTICKEDFKKLYDNISLLGDIAEFQEKEKK